MSYDKPLHRFAIVLWALAVVYLVVVPQVSWSLYRDATQVASTLKRPDAPAVMNNSAWRLFSGALFSAAELAAAGFVIELLDAIRWTLTPPEERKRRRVRGDDASA